jgi:hypothetical protein
LPSNIHCRHPAPVPQDEHRLFSTRHLNSARVREASDNLYFVFHVKRFVKVNKTISFTYTKFAEDHVQHILDVDPAEQSAERLRRDPQILRRQFLAFLNRRQTAL